MSEPIEGFSRFSHSDIDAARAHIAPKAPDHIIRLVLYRCAQLGCDPFARMIYAVPRANKTGQPAVGCPGCGKKLRYREDGDKDPWYCWRKQGISDGCGKTFPKSYQGFPTLDAEQTADTWILQCGIDLFRSVAESSSEYRGQEDMKWCGPDGVWQEVWGSGMPFAARAGIFRRGWDHPIRAVAHFCEYADEKSPMWKPDGMPRLMIAKCAEALDFRKAFPQKLSGLYIPEEMDQAQRDVTPEQAQPAIKAAPVALNPAAVHPTVADATKAQQAAPIPEAILALGKQLGKLAPLVARDVQAANGDIDAVRKAYEAKIAEKNPRGAQAPVEATVTEKTADSIALAVEAVPTSQPEDGGNPAASEEEPLTASAVDGGTPSSDDLEAQTQGVVNLMGVFEDLKLAFPTLNSRLEYCAKVVGRSVLAYGDLSADELTRICKQLVRDEQPAKATPDQVKQMQAACMDKDFLPQVLEQSKAFREATDMGAQRPDAIKAARLALAEQALGHPVTSFGEIFAHEVPVMMAFIRRLRAKKGI
jgi:hypothetical protein